MEIVVPLEENEIIKDLDQKIKKFDQELNQFSTKFYDKKWEEINYYERKPSRIFNDFELQNDTNSTNHKLISSFNAENYDKHENLSLPLKMKGANILNGVITILKNSSKGSKTKIDDWKPLESLLTAFFWWIQEKEFGEKRIDVLKKLYTKISTSFVNLISTTEDFVLDHLSEIISKSIWVCFWHIFTENRVDLTRPVFLSQLCYDINFQITGCAPQIANWRNWNFKELLEDTNRLPSGELQFRFIF
jgi:hypothetical protein